MSRKEPRRPALGRTHRQLEALKDKTSVSAKEEIIRMALKTWMTE